MDQFEIWVYRGLIGLLLIVVWWVVKRWADGISNKFDKLIKLMNDYTTKTAEQEVRLSTLEKRADNHGERIRDLEIDK